MKPIFVLFIFALTILVMPSCAYKLRSGMDELPDGVQRIQIPIFKNNSIEPSAEIYFTNSLKSEALRSRSARLVNDEAAAEAVLQGTVSNIEVLADESLADTTTGTYPYLPGGTVLALQYKVSAVIDLVLKKRGSNKILWSGNFKQTRSFPASHITLPVINTSNSLYNQSAKRQTLDALSKEMMQAAFDRMIERF